MLLSFFGHSIALSSEVGTGSREEKRLKQETGARFSPQLASAPSRPPFNRI
jgi:hypothetical protein